MKNETRCNVHLDRDNRGELGPGAGEYNFSSRSTPEATTLKAQGSTVTEMQVDSASMLLQTSSSTHWEMEVIVIDERSRSRSPTLKGVMVGVVSWEEEEDGSRKKPSPP